MARLRPKPRATPDDLAFGLHACELALRQGLAKRLLHAEGASNRRGASGPSLALVLDGVTDPQNTGAVLRVAVATGAEVVVLPPRRGATLTPGVHRASAGLSFLAPVAAPQNLARALGQLKDAGYWVVAASPGEGAGDATAFDWPDCTALVLGGEERGVSRLLNELSDFRVQLPMDDRVESLNVGVACGALAYLWRARWPAKT